MAEEKKRNFVGAGIWATAAWLAFCALYIHFTNGWADFLKMPANNFGDFLAGAFAPVAFFWLALGLFVQAQQLELQRSELALQREELKLQRKETERLANEAQRQATAIEANELHARRDTFFRIATMIESELNEVMHRMINLLTANENVYRSWEYVKMGSRHAIAGLLHRVFDDDKEMLRVVLGEENKYGLSENMLIYCGRFEALLKEADNCSKTGDIRNMYEKSPFGAVYLRCYAYLDRELPDLKARVIDKSMYAVWREFAAKARHRI